MFLFIALGAAFFAGMGVLTSLRVLREYERAIVFRLGRARKKALGPGVVLMLPFGLDRATVVDTRTKVIQIPPQEVITRDNISIGVDAVVYADVASPADAVLRVEVALQSTSALTNRVKNAARLLRYRFPLRRIVTLTEEPDENFARVVLHRQWRV